MDIYYLNNDHIRYNPSAHSRKTTNGSVLELSSKDLQKFISAEQIVNREYLKAEGNLKIINGNLELEMIQKYLYSTHMEMKDGYLQMNSDGSTCRLQLQNINRYINIPSSHKAYNRNHTPIRKLVFYNGRVYLTKLTKSC